MHAARHSIGARAHTQHITSHRRQWWGWCVWMCVCGGGGYSQAADPSLHDPLLAPTLPTFSTAVQLTSHTASPMCAT
jgi:hypothetical protein